MPGIDPTTRLLEARRVRGFQLAAAIALLVVVLRATPLTGDLFPFALIEHYCYDLMFELAPPVPPDDITIVEIDDKSLQSLGRFQSWHRDRYAALLDGPLAEAKLVAFDILFPEPDPHPVASGKGPADRARTPDGSPMTADDAFARAMEDHGRVVLAAHWGRVTDRTRAYRNLVSTFGYPHVRNDLAPPGRGEALAIPTPKLAAAAAAVGYVDIAPDPDGIYRRFRPLMVGLNSKLFPHFGTAIAALATGAGPGDILADVPEGRIPLSEEGAQATPIDPGGTTLINYCGPIGTVPRLSFVDVMRDDSAAEELRGEIVLVGVTAPGLYDVRPGPYRKSNRIFYGVETNANIVHALLRRPPVRDVRGSYIWLLVALALGVLAGATVWFARIRVAVALAALFFLPVAAISFFAAFQLLNQWIPYGAVLYATALPLIICLPIRLTEERRLIQRQFGVYVSPHVLSQLMSKPELIRQSQRRPITLLFADVRGSTTLSESIAPEVWVEQLNEYLTQMSDAIFAYDGYLDKFMGDGIMAVWNAFGTQPENHPELAVRAGMQMLRRLELLNQRWEQMDNRTPFQIGIGIHTGQAVMGNVGSVDRVQYTAIGDVVNTASRIERMCKEFGSEFIISQDTADEIGDAFALRELGETEVRGRSAPISVYEVVRRATADAQKGGNARAVLAQEEKTGPEKR